MALIVSSRQTKVAYGTQATYTFSVNVFTTTITGNSGLQYMGGVALDVFGTSLVTSTNFPAISTESQYPMAGTFTIAGSNVVLSSSELDAYGNGVARRISLTAITGWTVAYSPKNPNVITLISTTVGPTTAPIFTGLQAMGIALDSITFINGTAIPAFGPQDDVKIVGHYPLTFRVQFTGATIPSLQVSYGTEQEQQAGQLFYEPALTLTADASGGYYATLATPANYVRMTTISGNTQATLYVAS